ncbi:MAG: response regulator transcription factor [Cyclobacteriaceae bacterium]
MSIYERRVVIVEDNSELSNLYSFLVNGINNYEVVAVYRKCEDVIKEIGHDRPDLIMMDLELPGMSGTEGIRQIKKKYPRIDILVVTIHENDESIFQALSAGACGYLSKTAGLTEIEKAFEQIEMGGAYMTSRIARKVIGSFQKSYFSPLTKRETEILTLISKGKTYSMIADELGIANDTVKSHIKNIYSKLHVDTKADAISLAMKEKFI